MVAGEVYELVYVLQYIYLSSWRCFKPLSPCWLSVKQPLFMASVGSSGWQSCRVLTAALLPRAITGICPPVAINNVPLTEGLGCIFWDCLEGNLGNDLLSCPSICGTAAQQILLFLRWLWLEVGCSSQMWQLLLFCKLFPRGSSSTRLAFMLVTAGQSQRDISRGPNS